MSRTHQQPFTLEFPDQPERTLRGRIEWREGTSDPAPAVLVLHGFKGFMDYGFFPFVQQRLAQAGLVSVAVNVSGSGIGEDPLVLSEEDEFATNTYSRELGDIERLLEFVQAGAAGAPVDAARIGVLGHSRGGGMALLLASRQPGVRAVATWAAVDSFDRISADQRAALERDGHIFIPNLRTGQQHRIDRVVLEDFEANREAFDVLAACGRIECPALVVHGRTDPAVEPEAASRIHGALASGHKELAIEGDGHTFGARHPFEGAPVDLDRLTARTVAHFTQHLCEG